MSTLILVLQEKTCLEEVGQGETEGRPPSHSCKLGSEVCLVASVRKPNPVLLKSSKAIHQFM
jgi:hypothetical protein